MYHDAIVDEAPSVPCRFQMRVLFGAGDFNTPHFLPGFIKLNMNRIDTRMVWSDCIAHVSWNSMLLGKTKQRKHIV